MTVSNKGNNLKLAYQQRCIQLINENNCEKTEFYFETIQPVSPTLIENDEVNPNFTFQLTDTANYCFILSAENIIRSASGNPYFVIDNYILGYARSKISYPRIIIHPINLALLVLSLFGSRYHTLSNNKKFNRRFQIALYAHPNKLTPFRDELAQGLNKFRELHLELSGHHCCYTASLKPFSMQTA